MHNITLWNVRFFIRFSNQDNADNSFIPLSIQERSECVIHSLILNFMHIGAIVCGKQIITINCAIE